MSEVAKLVAWVVRFSNYEPPEIDSHWASEKEAQKQADVLNEKMDWGPWHVEQTEIHSHWDNKEDAHNDEEWRLMNWGDDIPIRTISEEESTVKRDIAKIVEQISDSFRQVSVGLDKCKASLRMLEAELRRQEREQRSAKD